MKSHRPRWPVGLELWQYWLEYWIHPLLYQLRKSTHGISWSPFTVCTHNRFTRSWHLWNMSWKFISYRTPHDLWTWICYALLCYYSAFPISRGHCYFNNSPKTAIYRPLGCLSWIRNLVEVLPAKLLCCVQYRVILHNDISRVYSISFSIISGEFMRHIYPHYSTLINHQIYDRHGSNIDICW